MMCVVLAVIPPLTDGERGRLETAVDGRDHREEAFAALLDNTRRWTPGAGDAAVHPEPNLEAMITDPGPWRGAVCRLAGRLEQMTPMAPPFEGVAEWVVRDDSGRPVLVYVQGLPPDHGFRAGRGVSMLARFYKRVDAVAQDGRVHSYPAFVGAWPESAVGADAPMTQLWAVVIPVAVMLGVFMALLFYARRDRPATRAHARSGGPWPTDPAEPLPPDPADALAELRRRAESSE
jgi:hypothetical protein